MGGVHAESSFLARVACADQMALSMSRESLKNGDSVCSSRAVTHATAAAVKAGEKKKKKKKK